MADLPPFKLKRLPVRSLTASVLAQAGTQTGSQRFFRFRFHRNAGNTMTTEQLEKQVLDKLHRLPREKRVEVLDFVTFLSTQQASPRGPSRSLRGLWSELRVDLSADDIAEARREMWEGFPREGI